MKSGTLHKAGLFLGRVKQIDERTARRKLKEEDDRKADIAGAMTEAGAAAVRAALASYDLEDPLEREQHKELAGIAEQIPGFYV